MVFIKVGVLLALIAYGGWWIWHHAALAGANLRPFIPPNSGVSGQFGWSGDLARGGGDLFRLHRL